jgi:hypothetical protein
MNITTNIPTTLYTRQLNSPKKARLSPPYRPPCTPTSLEITSPTLLQKQEHIPQCPAPLQSPLKPGYELRFDKLSSTIGETKSQTIYHHPLPTQNTFNTYYSEPPKPYFRSDVDAYPMTPRKMRTPQTAHAEQGQYLPTTTYSNEQTYIPNVSNHTLHHLWTSQYHNFSETRRE